MSRICGGRSGMSHENLPQHHLSQQEKSGSSSSARDVGQQQQRRSALRDISAIVSNVSASTGSLAKGLASAATGRAKAGLFTTGGSSGQATSLQQHHAHAAGHGHTTTAMETEEMDSCGQPIFCAAEGGVMDVDKADVEDPQCVTEYLGDIFRHFRQEEHVHQPPSNYMEKQVDINEKMRGILVDWLVEVHLKYKLKPETLYLGVNLIDRFLARRQVSRKKLQLVGVCGLLIAAKYEEIYPPEIRDFVYITDKAYNKEEILQMEISMLNVLEFHVTVPSPVAFLERFERVGKFDEVHANLSRYVMELTLCDIKMLQYCPSHLAAAAVFLSNKLLRRHPAWPKHMINHTRYSEEAIKSCAKEMCCLVEGADRSSLTAVRKKYAHQRFNSVSTMVASA